MPRITEVIDERIIELQKIIDKKTNELRTAPKGSLHVSESRSRVQFYLKDNSLPKKKRYLKNSEKQMVQSLCQKDYDYKVLQVAQNELQQLIRLREKYPEENCEEVYQGLSSSRKKFVEPIYLPDKEFVQHWQQVEYQRKGFKEDAPEYFTEKGE